MKSIVASLLGLALVSVIVLSSVEVSASGWSAEDRLSVEYPIQSNDVEIDVGGNGQAIAGWNCYDTVQKRTSCWVSFYDPVRGWTGGSMFGSASQNSYIQKVAINSHGAAVAAWVRGSGGYAMPMASYYDPAIGWKEAATLGTVMTNQIYSMDASINDQGEAVVSWSSTDFATYTIGACFYSTSNGWGQGLFQSTIAGMQDNPLCGIGEDGSALMVWREWIPAGQNYHGYMRFSSYDPTDGWSPVSAINSDRVGLGSPDFHMDMDGLGRAVVGYSYPNQTTGRVDARAAYYTGGTWLPPVQLNTESDDKYAMCPDVSLTKDGKGMVLWSYGNISWNEWQYRTFDHGAFGAIQSLPLPSILGLNWPYLALSDNMYAIATTTMRMDGEVADHAYAALYSPATGWSEWERLDKNCPYSIYFLVRGGVDNSGRAVVAWISNDDSSETNRSIWATSFAPSSAEVDIQKEVNNLKDQLTMALVIAAVAAIVAVASIVLLLRRKAG